ncbi:MAG: hypothetical protein Q9160_004567 [Pyrenula sp. 1 TL-2023]
MVASRSLDFDLIVLKPEVSPIGARFNTTLQFKQDFLRELLCTYREAQELRIYEDRPNHVKNFRNWFEGFNKTLLSHPIDQPPPPRKPINADVIAVAELVSSLDPVTETCIVQKLINKHNAALSSPNFKQLNITNSRSGRKIMKRHFVLFGHLINMTDSARLITLIDVPQNLVDTKEVKFLASSISVAAHEPSDATLDRLGGYGRKIKWQVIGTAVWENKIWAAKCTPLIDDEVDRQRISDACDCRFPVIVLALKKGNKPIEADRIREGSYRDLPPEKQFIFETVMANKEFLEICDDPTSNGFERGYDNYNNNNISNNNRTSFKRKYDNSYAPYNTKENFPPLPSQRDRDRDRDRDHDGPPVRNRDRDRDFDRDRDRDDFRPPRRGGANGNGRYFNAGINEDSPNQQRGFAGTVGGRGNAGGGGRGGGGVGRGGGNPGSGRRNDRDRDGLGGRNRGAGGDRRDRERDGERGRGGGGPGGGGGRGGRMRGDGGGGGGGGGGPRGYKSLDDFGGGGFGGDGAWDGKGAGGAGGGEMVMNY